MVLEQGFEINSTHSTLKYNERLNIEIFIQT